MSWSGKKGMTKKLQSPLYLILNSHHTCSLVDQSSVLPHALSNPTSTDNSRATSVDPSLGDDDEPSSAKAPPRKKRKGCNSEDVQDVIISRLREMDERRSKEVPLDDNHHFALHVAGILRRLGPRQRAMAKVQIEQLLLDFEFPPEDQYAFTHTFSS